MPRPKRKTKAEDLARIRNNQRRSRERRKQYVIELEERAAATAAQPPKSSLESENSALRSLLESVGFDQPYLDRYLQGTTSELPLENTEPSNGDTSVFSNITPLVEMNQDVSTSLDAVTINAQPMEPSHATELPLVGFPELDPAVGDVAGDVTGRYFSFDWDLDLALNAVQTNDLFSGLSVLMNDPIAALDNSDGVITGTNSVNEETTLCSVAFRLVAQCNHNSINSLELETKLRYGYKMPTNVGEGCRVDNRTLLAVLAELI
ncbi:hypothetical protein BJX99DRAFT_125749 [Aspergillus californicus]